MQQTHPILLWLFGILLVVGSAFSVGRHEYSQALLAQAQDAKAQLDALNDSVLETVQEQLSPLHGVASNGVLHPDRASSLSAEWSAPEIVQGVMQQYRAAFGRLQAVEQELLELRQTVDLLREKGVLVVDLSDQKLTYIEHGKIVAAYTVSTGAADTPTPQGRYRIERKQELRVGKSLPYYRMKHYLAFTPNGAYGLHALPYLGRESDAFWREAEQHLGHPVSHGCVRLKDEDVALLFEQVELGTTVWIVA